MQKSSRNQDFSNWNAIVLNFKPKYMPWGKQNPAPESQVGVAVASAIRLQFWLVQESKGPLGMGVKRTTWYHLEGISTAFELT